jgi:hypothetical protein
MSDHVSESRQPSVDFEDDVFYDHAPSIPGTVSSHISRSHNRNSIQDPILHNHNDHRMDDYSGDRTLNNKNNRSNRHGSQSSNEYVLYYGKNIVEPIDLNKYQDFDRNDLYEKVRK